MSSCIKFSSWKIGVSCSAILFWAKASSLIIVANGDSVAVGLPPVGVERHDSPGSGLSETASGRVMAVRPEAVTKVVKGGLDEPRGMRGMCSPERGEPADGNDDGDRLQLDSAPPEDEPVRLVSIVGVRSPSGRLKSASLLGPAQEGAEHRRRGWSGRPVGVRPSTILMHPELAATSVARVPF